MARKIKGKIITANSWFNMDLRHFRNKVARASLGRRGISDMGVNAEIAPLEAFVNRGRWLIVCPDCGGGEYVWEEGFVMCFSCLNSSLGHQWRTTKFPKYRRQIEELLIVRPLVNRNWNLSETLEDLKKENEEHRDELLIKEVSDHGLDNSVNP